ncbi:MAG: hypothetical protein VX913_14390 [Planctomycetota bacterium]|nr:hypothetical protein [Planctomycetota bacterium]MEE2713954.1 hypothetical protein [Planctomycetota bacterium]
MAHVILSCAQIFVVGLGLCVVCGWDLRALGLRGPAIAWVVGAFAVAAVVLVAGFAECLVGARVVVGLLSVVLGVSVVLRPAWRARLPRVTVDRTDPVRAALVVVLGAWLLSGWLYSSDYPLTGDEDRIWAARAVAARQAGGFGDGYQAALDVEAQQVGHGDYPPLNSLLQLWAMLGAGGDLGNRTRLPILLFDLASLLFLVGLLRMRTRGWLGVLVAVGPFLTVWYGSPTASADRLVALGALMSMSGPTLPLGLALMVCAKHEGAALAAVLAVSLALTRVMARPRDPWCARNVLSGYLLAGALLAGIWAWNAACGLSNDIAASGLFTRLIEVGPDRLGVLLAYLWDDFLSAPTASALLLPLAVGASVLRPSSLRHPHVMLPALVASGASLAFFVVFLATPHGLAWHWDTAGPRVFSQLTLVTALWAGCALDGGVSLRPPAR